LRDFLNSDQGSVSGLDQKLDVLIQAQAEVVTVLQELLHVQRSLQQRLGNVARREHLMKCDLSDLKAQIHHLSDAGESAKTLIQGLASKIDELANQPTIDQQEVQALAQEVRAQADGLAEAVVASTPSEK
jgi:chromosome segregation ATPase